MTLKEAYINTLRFINDKDELIKQKVVLMEYLCATDIHLHPSEPTMCDPEARGFIRISFKHTSDECGFVDTSSCVTSTVSFPTTEDETAEIKYILHGIKVKLREIQCDKLSKLIHS